MKRAILLSVITLFVVFNGTAQSESITGVWKLTSSTLNDEFIITNTLITFGDEGSLQVRGEVCGSWHFEAEQNRLTFITDGRMELDGAMQVKEMTLDRLVLIGEAGESNTLQKISLPAGTMLKNGVTGVWLMHSVVVDGKPVKFRPERLSFQPNGIFYQENMVVGTWEYPSDRELILHSDRVKEMNGKAKLCKLSKNAMQLLLNGAVISFKRWDEQEVIRQNKAAGIAGTWRMPVSDNSTLYFQLSLPNQMEVVNKADGLTTKISGQWSFHAKENTLLLLGGRFLLAGQNQVLKKTGGVLQLKHGQEIFSAQQVNNDTDRVERLAFTSAQFDDEAEDQLPWYDFNAMLSLMEPLNDLQYRHGHLVGAPDAMEFNTIRLVPDVDVSNQRMTMSSFSIVRGDTLQISQEIKGEMSNRSNGFYPMPELYPYRVVDTSVITVPGGLFDCTVVEGFYNEQKVKYWMVNEQPGVYAKIIRDGEDAFGDVEYHLLQLQNIRLK